MNKLIELKDAIKSKILFRSEDGVDIFEGDDVWGIEIITWDVFKRNSLTDPKSVLENWLHGKFSTKEKAEDYILMNKPCLSINDIKPWYIKWRTSFTKNSLIEGLEELVKSKL